MKEGVPVAQHLPSRGSELRRPQRSRYQGLVAALAGLQRARGFPCLLCLSQAVKQRLNRVCSALETESPRHAHASPQRTAGPAIQRRRAVSEREDSSSSCVSALDRQERQPEITALPRLGSWGDPSADV